MKNIILIIMALFTFTTCNAQESIYDVAINDISGNPIDLSAFKGKHILFVNVASECGFTPQYAGLEELHQQFKEGLVVIGLPCNQFGEQEKGTEKEIQQFCTNKFGVSFLLTEKIEVKGKRKHPLYSWLTDKKINGKSSSSVKWNFQKYVVDGEGEFVNYFYSTTKPMSPKITSILKQ
ncbi:glutathione peroxidase [Flavobacteriales bacterium]|nr:glutathione peroxidase [Flavobacteriales bacterium]MDC3394809.1 glutathione peroxidase [Flavobacteriales bacterium]